MRNRTIKAEKMDMFVAAIQLPAWFPTRMDTIAIVGFAFGCVFFLGWVIVSVLSRKRSSNLDALNENILQGVTKDRRATPRRKGNLVKVLLREENQEEIFPGWVFDRSIGGVGLILDQPVQPGLTLEMRAQAAPEPATWFKVTVRSCRRDGIQYEVGCQFHHIPSWNDLLSLG